MPVLIGAKWQSNGEGLEHYTAYLLDDTCNSVWFKEFDFYAASLDQAYNAVSCLFNDQELQDELKEFGLERIGGVLTKTFLCGFEYQIATFICDKNACSPVDKLIKALRAIAG